MSEDEHHKNSAKVQELTDKLIKEIDQTLATKETEINRCKRCVCSRASPLSCACGQPQPPAW